MKMHKKALLAAAATVLVVGEGGAYAATSEHERSTATPPAAPAASQPPLTNPHGFVGAAIAKALADGRISTTEAALANLFLAGQITPDQALRDSWRPVVQAAADALGLSVGSLEADLADGQSLADIAGRQGRSPAAVAQAIQNSSRTALAKAVTDGALSTAAGADILELLQTDLNDVLSTHP